MPPPAASAAFPALSAGGGAGRDIAWNDVADGTAAFARFGQSGGLIQEIDGFPKKLKAERRGKDGGDSGGAGNKGGGGVGKNAYQDSQTGVLSDTTSQVAIVYLSRN